MKGIEEPVAIVLLVSIGIVSSMSIWFYIANMTVSPIGAKEFSVKEMNRFEIIKLDFMMCIEDGKDFRKIVFYNPTYRTIILKNKTANLRDENYSIIGKITFHENANPYETLTGNSSVSLIKGKRYRVTFEDIGLPDIPIICY